MNPSAAFAGHIAAYLAHGRALGRQYRQEHWLLHTLLRELLTLGFEDLTAQSFQSWFDHRSGLHPNTRRKWVQILRRFCLLGQRSDPGCFVPGAELICRAQPCVTRVILGNSQIARMIAVADTLEPSPNSPARSAAMRMAAALLYTTGMRLGELLRLVLGDIEDDGTVLRVRESKFHKTRLLPLSPSAQAELRAYLTRRAGAGFDIRPGAPLLCTRARGRIRPYSASGMQQGLNALLRNTSVCAARQPRPRVHDLRHNSESRIIPSTASAFVGRACRCSRFARSGA